MKEDPLWNEYLEAVRGLADVPTSLATLAEQARTEREQTIAQASNNRDTELRRCNEWSIQARRALSNAEARLVASKVLIPSGGNEVRIEQTDPELLAEQLRGLSRQFETELTAMLVAWRRIRETETTSDVGARRKMFLRRRFLVGGVIAGAVLLLILGMWWGG